MANLSNEQILSNIYYDLERGYGSAKSLYEQAREDGTPVSMEEVKKFLKKQPNKQVKGYKNFNTYMPSYARDVYSIDIMDMVAFIKDKEGKTVEKDRMRYALIVIDNFSKFANVVPMKNKDSPTVLSALKESLKKMGFPITVFSDSDGAFQSVVKEFLEGEGVNVKTTLTHANVAERLIRSIKKGIADRVRFTNGQWETLLIPTLNKYNNTIHSSIDMKPKDVHDDKNEVKVKAELLLKQKKKRIYPNISKGDKVKIYQKGAGNYTSRKEYNSRWSDKVYTVEEVGRDISLNKYYKIEGQNRKYNRHELLLLED